MSLASADAVERSVYKTNEWLNGIRDELGQDDREEAWRILKAHLQVLRGAFYEGFDPDTRRRCATVTSSSRCSRSAPT
jgi:hypothetical protein